MTEEQLRDLVLELATREESVLRLLALRAATQAEVPTGLADDLLEMTRSALATRGLIDYRRSFEVARDAEEVLDQLEEVLEVGAADAAAPALLKATTRLRTLTLNADDSGGVIGNASQRSVDLYARACREGNPDPAKLARWLLKFRADSPGWPQVQLHNFVAAFDDHALATYRKGVDALADKLAAADRWQQTDVRDMQVELADHDSDVDRAVHLLSIDDEHVMYGAIVNRLKAAGRSDDVIAWMDRAVTKGRLSLHQGTQNYWLHPQDVADTYRDVGRLEDALAVFRSVFRGRPGVEAYRMLLDFARGEGCEEQERAWAIEHARQSATRAGGNGAVLIELALNDHDLDAAWDAATTFGPGHGWGPLARASAVDRPIAAAGLYKPHLEQELKYADTRKYPPIAKTLVTMKELYERGGRPADFDEYLAGVRETYAKRTSLMRALDKHGL
ncbi:MAG: hypothetical protein WB767_10475 [Nocardioides sp.]